MSTELRTSQQLVLDHLDKACLPEGPLLIGLALRLSNDPITAKLGYAALLKVDAQMDLAQRGGRPA